MRRPGSTLLASDVPSGGSLTLCPPTLASGALADDAHALPVGATDKAGNISRLDLSFSRDTTAATVPGRLTRDTGASASDVLTNDPQVAGTVTGANGIANFCGALDRGASRAVTSALQPDGSFDLAPASDSEKTGGHATTVIPVTLQGSTDPNAQVTLVGKGLIADPAGAFRFDNVRLLALGDNNFTAQATDAAGNQSSYALTITLDKSHAAVANANGDGKQDAGDTTDTGNVIATDQGTGGGQTVTATATDTVTLQQSPATTGVTS